MEIAKWSKILSPLPKVPSPNQVMTSGSKTCLCYSVAVHLWTVNIRNRSCFIYEMGKIKSTSEHLCGEEESSTLAPVQASLHMARPLPSLTKVSFLVCQGATVTTGCLRTSGKLLAMDLSMVALNKHWLSMYPGYVG